VPSETTAGPNMMEDTAIAGIKESAKQVRLDLRARYMNGYTPSFAN
jgi:hypothetical protein